MASNHDGPECVAAAEAIANKGDALIAKVEASLSALADLEKRFDRLEKNS